MSSLTQILRSWVRIPLKACISVCVCLFCVCVVLCVVSGLATSWSLVQGVLPSQYRLRNCKSSQVASYLIPPTVLGISFSCTGATESRRQSGRAGEGMNCLQSLERWDRGFEYYSRYGCLYCVRLFCVCVVLCLGSGLATSWSLVQGDLRLCKTDYESRDQQSPVEPLMKERMNEWIEKISQNYEYVLST
jgi:hypothetical protein